MDHKTAESLQAAEKYTLNEMSADERLQFEEHLFDCPVCADQLRQNFTVVENLKEVLSEQRLAAQTSPAGWREWFRMPSLVPAMLAVALAGVVVVQNVSPRMPDMQAEILAPTPVLEPVARGDMDAVKVIRSRPMFMLSFGVDSSRPDSYLCEFNDNSGKQILALKSTPQSRASVNLQFLLPASSFPAGRYEMVLRPASEPGSITKYPFIIEDSK